MKRKNFLDYLFGAFWFLIENGPAFLTIFFASYVLLLARRSTVTSEELLKWVLALVGLLAVSGTIERLRKLNRLERLTSSISETIEHKLVGRVGAETFFTDAPPSMELYWEKANTIWLSGVVMQAWILQNVSLLARRLKAGATIKVLIVNPHGEAANCIANPDAKLTLEYLQANSRVTLQNLKWLASAPSIKGHIEARYKDHVPFFSLMAADPEMDNGTMFIGLYRQFWSRERHPYFELVRGRDGRWYEYFLKQFEEAWDNAKAVQLVDEQLLEELTNGTSAPSPDIERFPLEEPAKTLPSSIPKAVTGK